MAAGCQVLILEDHEALNDLFARALQRAGFIVHAAYSAEEVAELPVLGQIAVFIVDWNLPGESGLSFVRRMREAFPDAGYIIVTARNGSDNHLLGYANGADLYLPKPVRSDDLVLAIDLLLKRRVNNTKMAPTDWQKGCLYRDQLVVEIEHQHVSLSMTETRLLLAFCAAKDNTLEVWQISEVLSNGLLPKSMRATEVQLSRLRKKLSTVYDGNPLMVDRGNGYRLMIDLTVK